MDLLVLDEEITICHPELISGSHHVLITSDSETSLLAGRFRMTSFII
jgi:hypothetical protein